MLFRVDWHIHITYVPIVSYCPLQIHVAMIAMIDMQSFFLGVVFNYIRIFPSNCHQPKQRFLVKNRQVRKQNQWRGLASCDLETQLFQRLIFFGGPIFFFVVGWGGKMHHNWNPSHLESS